MRESSLWSALGDPTRRALVDLRLVEPAPVRVLARVPDHTTGRLEAPPRAAPRRSGGAAPTRPRTLVRVSVALWCNSNVYELEAMKPKEETP